MRKGGRKGKEGSKKGKGREGKGREGGSEVGRGRWRERHTHRTNYTKVKHSLTLSSVIYIIRRSWDSQTKTTEHH